MIRRGLLLLATIVGSVGAFSLLAFWSHLNPPTFVSPLSPGDLGLSYETIQLETDDGIVLDGWFLPRQGGEPEVGEPATLIVLHGWPEDKGSVLRSAAPLTDRFNLLLFDFRGLGRSQGRHSTLGGRETKDVRAALDWLEERGHHQIGIWGFSMGGAVALMSAAEDSRITAVASDTSFARLDLMARDLFRVPVLGHAMALGMRTWSRLFLGIDIRRIAPVGAASSLQIPVLIIHLEEDPFVPFAHALRLEAALEGNPQARFWFREEGAYGQVPPEYAERLRGFFAEHIPGPRSRTGEAEAITGRRELGLPDPGHLAPVPWGVEL